MSGQRRYDTAERNRHGRARNQFQAISPSNAHVFIANPTICADDFCLGQSCLDLFHCEPYLLGASCAIVCSQRREPFSHSTPEASRLHCLQWGRLLSFCDLNHRAYVTTSFVSIFAHPYLKGISWSVGRLMDTVERVKT